MSEIRRTWCRPILISLLVVGAAFVLAVWLLARDWPPDPGTEPHVPSAFYTACKDWPATAGRAAPDPAAIVDSTFIGAGSGEGGRSIQHRHEHCFYLRGREATARFVEALRAELRRLARETGAEVTGEDAAAFTDGLLRSFTLRFRVGRGNGEVRVRVVKSDDAQRLERIYKVQAEVGEEVR